MDNYNYNMFSLARESRMLSQSRFAELAGYSQASISKIENGLIPITDNIVEKYQEILQYKKPFFNRDYQPSLTLVNYRKNNKLGVKAQSSIESIFNIIISNLSILCRHIEVKHIDFKIPVSEENTPFEIANQIRSLLSLPFGPIINLSQHLERSGIIIVELDLDRNFNGAQKRIDNLNIIFINKNLPADRYRFTLAHELGHLVMHDYQDDKSEPEANEFASELLMPSRIIKNELLSYERLGSKQLEELKYRWMTSMMSIIYKANSLNIIDKEEVSKLYRMLYSNKKIFNKVELLQLPKERPKLLQQIFNFYIRNLQYSYEEMQDLLGLEKKDLLEMFNIKEEPVMLKIKSLYKGKEL